ncbi:response regulator transcription factor [Halobacillus mangrovi]|uniref:DNA-binding response regulator n=1 Tax=Halobacillus mangrovi TaxID=402384 RepID=A0A1W5ZSP2_9BACI|nr:response regulator [Halobacillus mangrovi]ARI76326.1 hypothetical protein HM131_05515 [Halobacillus mangrovi]
MAYNVVIADDEPLILKNLKGIIDWESLDCKVIATARNGVEVLEVLQQEPVDLLLTDISMPEMTGVEVLKEMYSWSAPPLAILLSGYDEFSYAREGLKYNALDYFLKPIDYEELEESILKALTLIKERKEQAYDRKKQSIYDQVMSGATVPNEAPFRVYVSIFIWNTNDQVIKDIECTRMLLQKHDSKSYLYQLDESLAMIVLEYPEHKEAEAEARDLAKKGAELTEDSVWAIGSGVRGMNSCKASADEAKFLLKFASFTDERVITKAHIDQAYTSKANAIDAVEQGTKYVKDHFYEDLSIEQVADEVGISVSYFSQLFKQKHGMTFIEFVRVERMDHACTLLRNSELETYRIAEKVGYTDQRYFSQVFKKVIQMTPSQYRKTYK